MGNMKHIMKIEKRKISVIIPAYNAETYLQKCVESVILQSYTNFEIIIIDDGSKDGTLKVAKQLELQDKRIKVIHQENRGLPAARNTGLRNANGEFVFFLDSDDWIEKRCFDTLIKLQNKYNADILMFGYYKEYHNKQVKCCIYDKICFYEKDIIVDFNIYDMRTITAWGKLYSRACIGNNWYDEAMRTAEDVDFNYKIYSNIKRAVYAPECLLHYRILPKSAIHGYDAKIEEKFCYPLYTVRTYMFNGTEMQRKAYFSFASIAYIVIAQNGIVLNPVINFRSKYLAIENLNKKEWVKELFDNIEYIQIPMSRKVIIICSKYKINFGILLAVIIKQKMEI